ncbi:MAG: hypothetical protein JXA91_01110 [Candidatus Thermoplasmatota archaeon]|nr:hypothetical protein [Candidatus Thermoplasmatota archaeon]
MGDEEKKSKNEEITRMFADNTQSFSSDEQLALHIMHRFNIDRETLESMPAFNDHLRPLFLKQKEE